jgi:hypothetical protein
MPHILIEDNEYVFFFPGETGQNAHLAESLNEHFALALRWEEAGSKKPSGKMNDGTEMYARLRKAMRSLPEESADALLSDLEKLLDGEMAMMAEVF